MDTVRVGVIGAGLMGERHCRVYSNLQHVKFVGLHDARAARGREIADKYGVRSFASPWELLREVDAVTIATPTPSHYELAMEAFAAGVHTLIEKPLAFRLDQARTLVEAARAAELVVQVGHIERFNPAFQELKNVTDDLPVVAIVIRRQNSFDASNKDVDVINDLMIHDIDLLLKLVGLPIESVSAYGRSLQDGAIDHAVANFCFQNGPIATLIASRITQQKVRSIDITARSAYVEADLMNKSLAIHRRVFSEFVSAKYRQESVIERIHIPVAEPLVLQLEHFIQCVRENGRPIVSVEDGLRALECAALVNQAIQQGQTGPAAFDQVRLSPVSVGA